MIAKLVVRKESSEQAERESSFNNVYWNKILKKKKGFEDKALIITFGN